MHINNNATAKTKDDDDYDPWHKFRPLLDRILINFKKFYIPSQDLSIDESMVGMKNRVAYIQYMPQKRHARFGIKKFELCESSTGYVVTLEHYAGKSLGLSGKPYEIVMRLMKNGNVLNKGHSLFTDNWYTSIRLMEDLIKMKVFVTGTVRKNAVRLPKAIVNAKYSVGQVRCARLGPILFTAYREKQSQKKPITLLSNAANAGMVSYSNSKGKEFTKPGVIKIYNIGMGGVDLSDKMVCHYAAERCSNRYWIKVVMILIDISLLNSYIIYSQNAIRKLSRYAFIREVVEGLCHDNFAPSAPSTVGAEHRIVKLPGKKESNCKVCSGKNGGKRKRSRFHCPACDCGVCIECYDILHSSF